MRELCEGKPQKATKCTAIETIPISQTNAATQVHTVAEINPSHASEILAARERHLLHMSEETMKSLIPVPQLAKESPSVVPKAPKREGKRISYLRLTAADGASFGHRLQYDIEVEKAEAESFQPQELEVFA
ncbi:hypothetical protein KHU50_010291 [Colletotrichum sp. SAR 10_65]|nr:hypothetical protein KHU50_010291 [Colletotrichum sp. SAR 10_65]KAI8175162.1 hypothetical protein K4K51_007843 [Colletotrichum sp. SAR 10_75]KAI8200498.1 hypothetical protein K4K52_007983 [Colletotrichum sp. SAR 10_76]